MPEALLQLADAPAVRLTAGVAAAAEFGGAVDGASTRVPDDAAAARLPPRGKAEATSPLGVAVHTRMCDRTRSWGPPLLTATLSTPTTLPSRRSGTTRAMSVCSSSGCRSEVAMPHYVAVRCRCLML